MSRSRPPRIALCDYGVGNLRSVERALLAAGADARISDDPGEVELADALILPGVGAFGAAVEALAARGMQAAVIEVANSGRPVLGVCLGFQLLFDWSDESGGRPGLGLLSGRVTRLAKDRGKVPHMGWNTIQVRHRSRLLDGIASGTAMYFVHSYAVDATSRDVVAITDYGGAIVAACHRDNVMGTQFHPEKSGPEGLRVYANFAAIAAGTRVGSGRPRLAARIDAGPAA